MGDYLQTRNSLHGIAELLMAGPQWRASKEIELRVTPGGFGTAHAPDIRLDGLELVSGELRVPVGGGATYRDLATALSVTAEGPTGVYADTGDAQPDDLVQADAADVATLANALLVGQQALTAFAPDEKPILWPEHFDIGISVAEVNYGVSPGDSFLAEPYAYVGPWNKREGDFWNAPFGAARAMSEFGTSDAVVAFFQEGQQLAGA